MSRRRGIRNNLRFRMERSPDAEFSSKSSFIKLFYFLDKILPW